MEKRITKLFQELYNSYVSEYIYRSNNRKQKVRKFEILSIWGKE